MSRNTKSKQSCQTRGKYNKAPVGEGQVTMTDMRLNLARYFGASQQFELVNHGHVVCRVVVVAK